MSARGLLGTRQFELFVPEHDATKYLATQKLQRSAELGLRVFDQPFGHIKTVFGTFGERVFWSESIAYRDHDHICFVRNRFE